LRLSIWGCCMVYALEAVVLAAWPPRTTSFCLAATGRLQPAKPTGYRNGLMLRFPGLSGHIVLSLRWWHSRHVSAVLPDPPPSKCCLHERSGSARLERPSVRMLRSYLGMRSDALPPTPRGQNRYPCEAQYVHGFDRRGFARQHANCSTQLSLMTCDPRTPQAAGNEAWQDT
jgi:hypothetical protein